MDITGIICEYDPLHLGHKKQIDHIRQNDPNMGIVCLMSGNFVQRGKPALIDKSLRAKAAILTGADLVLEMPVTASLSSAENFASTGVKILGDFCSHLSFGAETADESILLSLAKVLLSAEFASALSKTLEQGLSFPAARQKALENMGFPGHILSLPNNILAVEYCKAIISQKSQLTPSPILRGGNYHDSLPDSENPSATAVRNIMLNQEDWSPYVPESVRTIYKSASLHALCAGETAVLGKLRSMSEESFSQLPYGSEGLWRKLMRSVQSEASLDAILTATKSKRYTRSRLDRMVMCAFLGFTENQLLNPVPYVRVLALNDRGREILKRAREHGCFPNTGEKMDDPYQIIENRCGDLYGLFALNGPEKPGQEQKRRVYYNRGDNHDCQ